MKKIFENIRHKIVRKLGGYVIDSREEYTVHVSQRKLVTMRSSRIVPTLDLNNIRLCEYHENELAALLVENLVSHGLIEVSRDKCDDHIYPGLNTTKLTAIITVAEPVNYEVNHFLGEEDDG